MIYKVSHNEPKIYEGDVIGYDLVLVSQESESHFLVLSQCQRLPYERGQLLEITVEEV